MGSDGVVLDPPVLDQGPGLEQTAAGPAAREFVAEAAAEALDIGFCQGEPGSM
jgi:hypothetical protein